jgi:hypothetical protein
MGTVKSETDNVAEAQADVSSEDKDRYIEIWKKAVETQMHFNEMSGKSRQLGLTFVAAALGVAVVMVARGDDFALPFFNWKIHVGVLLILAATLAISGVRVLDLTVYHRMLRGAVTFGEDFEKNYMSSIFSLNKGMTQAISHFSRFDDASVNKDGPRYIYCGSNQLTAEKKIKRFYNFTTAFLLVAAVGLFLINNFAQPSSKVAARIVQDQTSNEKPMDSGNTLSIEPPVK